MVDDTRGMTPPPSHAYLAEPAPQEYTLYSRPASAPPAAYWPEPSPVEPQRPRWVVPAVIVLTVCIIAAAAAIVAIVAARPDNDPSRPAARPTASPAPTGPGRAADPVAQQACDLIRAAEVADQLADPDAMEPIGKLAADSADGTISFRGRVLVLDAQMARAAKGASDEAVRVLGLMTASLDMATACIKGGYIEAG